MEAYDIDRQHHVDQGHVRCVRCLEWIKDGTLCEWCREARDDFGMGDDRDE